MEVLERIGSGEKEAADAAGPDSQFSGFWLWVIEGSLQVHPTTRAQWVCNAVREGSGRRHWCVWGVGDWRGKGARGPVSEGRLSVSCEEWNG